MHGGRNARTHAQRKPTCLLSTTAGLGGPRRGGGDRGGSCSTGWAPLQSIRSAGADRPYLFRGKGEERQIQDMTTAGAWPSSRLRVSQVACSPRRTRRAKVPKFRSHLPQDCPPPDSQPAEGVFYRLVSGDVVDESSFLSQHEMGKKCPIGAPACQWAGVSTFASVREASKLAGANGRLEGMKLARGTLTADLGNTKLTARTPTGTHTTYWPFEDAQPWIGFVILQKAEDDG